MQFRQTESGSLRLLLGRSWAFLRVAIPISTGPSPGSSLLAPVPPHHFQAASLQINTWILLSSAMQRLVSTTQGISAVASMAQVVNTRDVQRFFQAMVHENRPPCWA